MNNKTEIDPCRRGRPESTLGALPAAQRAQVDQWLFQERLPYGAVVKNCLQTFGVKTTVSSICRHYQRRAQELRLHRPAEASSPNASEGDAAALSPQDRYDRVLDAIEIKAMQLANQPLSEINIRELCELVHLIIAARREANEASRLALVRQKAEYDVAAACLEHKVEFDKIGEDPKLDARQQIQAVREELFGPDVPESSPR